MRTFTLAAAATLVLAAAAHGQSVDTRVAAVHDGVVEFTYPVRPGACNRFHDDAPACGRVVIRRQGGRTTSLRLHSREWTDSAESPTDLGTVAAHDAARFLLGQARSLGGHDAAAAIFGAALVDSVNVHGDLRALAGDASLGDDVRGDAMIALGGDDIDPDDVAYLERLSTTASDRLAERIFLAISRADDPKAGEWLLGVAADSTRSTHVREQALFWAGQSDIPTARLANAYAHSPNDAMKRRFIFVLSQRHDTDALDALMRIAREDPDRGARKQALFWLGQSHDPRAIHFLEQLVTR